MFTNISSPYLLAFAFIFLIGCCLGSFFNLVIYRLPLGLSLALPRSHCPSCKATIPPQGLLPIIGFLLLKGKCASCHTKISWRYPLIELLCGVVTLILFTRYVDELDFLNLIFSHHFSWRSFVPFIASLWLFYTGVVLSFIDLEHRILPDVITIPGTVVSFILGCFLPQVGPMQSFLGFLTGFGGLLLITKTYELVRKQEAMGFGDIKYLGFLGALIGPLGVFYTLLIASVIGSVVGITYGILTKKGLAVTIPFGPFLACGAFALFIWRF